MKHALCLVIVLFITYQYSLCKFNLKDFIFYSERSTFLSANREGFFSIFGYLSLYLISEYLSKIYIFSNYSIDPRQIPKNMFKLFIAFFCLYFISETLVQSISRRLANLTFVLYILMISYSLLFLLSLIDLYIQPINQIIPILQKISTHQLLLFLFANLLTGAINLSIKTIFMPDSIALIILAVYIIFIITLAINLS